jgi:hypothetical protein
MAPDPFLDHTMLVEHPNPDRIASFTQATFDDGAITQIGAYTRPT